MIELREICTVHSSYLPALINGDYSGLEQAENDLIDKWLDSFDYGLMTINIVDDSEQEFNKCEITGFMGNTTDIEIWS